MLESKALACIGLVPARSQLQLQEASWLPAHTHPCASRSQHASSSKMLTPREAGTVL